ncbi:MAG: UDP-2,3-diacylglucosamine diphosphatase [Bacteroidales bacterium]|nr:UDP-2,3-diacylglucosamine diphosphatase [Bacteroidales bacterium]MCF8388117.1 UDP-2,3-diacylglucosamine diphosphatase [Bacteroidales bacterium]MCF8398776.1 UDP-2,3-diacylglucosamine diphosphatase [Bacteroidales bacterium]
MHYKTIVISDTHLGSADTKAKELSKFLKANSCERLILNGDIIDAWNLKRSGNWSKKDTRIFRRILKMMESHDTEVIYVKGNHDDFLNNVIPFSMGKFYVLNSYELKSGDKTLFVTHGDIFDMISTNMKWLANLGDMGYKFLLWMNRRYNQRRRLKGLPYYSLSQEIKHKVKLAVNFIFDFENTMIEYARKRNYDGIICGHIHQPALKVIDDLLYLNSGDWVETMSALVEDFNHKWQVVYYDDIIPSQQGEIIFPD